MTESLEAYYVSMITECLQSVKNAAVNRIPVSDRWHVSSPQGLCLQAPSPAIEEQKKPSGEKTKPF